MVVDEGFQPLSGEFFVLASLSGELEGTQARWRPVVEVGVSVVGFALQPAALFAGFAAFAVGGDVVDVALVDRRVTHGGMGAVTVTDLDRPA